MDGCIMTQTDIVALIVIVTLEDAERLTHCVTTNL